MDREEFLKTIHFFPIWIKDEENLKTYAAHLHYRCIQARKEADILYKEMKKHLTNEIYEKIMEVSLDEIIKFDHWYNSYKHEGNSEI